MIHIVAGTLQESPRLVGNRVYPKNYKSCIEILPKNGEDKCKYKYKII